MWLLLYSDCLYGLYWLYELYSQRRQPDPIHGPIQQGQSPRLFVFLGKGKECSHVYPVYKKKL